MIFFLLTAALIADGGGAQTSEDSCDPHELKVCVDATPRTQVGLPRTKEELDNHCFAYQTGMSCMDTWIKRCLPTDGQKLVQQQIGGARALMRYLCSNDTALRRDFLKEPSCWSVVSPDWARCVDELQLASRDISERSHHLAYFNKNTELCWYRLYYSLKYPLLLKAACMYIKVLDTFVDVDTLIYFELRSAREAFVSCVGHAGRACSSAAGALLRRMAWVLAQDVAACSRAGDQPRAPCAAPQPPRLSALLSLLYYIYYI